MADADSGSWAASEATFLSLMSHGVLGAHGPGGTTLQRAQKGEEKCSPSFRGDCVRCIKMLHVGDEK